MARYWQPVALSEELPSRGAPLPVRIFGVTNYVIPNFSACLTRLAAYKGNGGGRGD